MNTVSKKKKLTNNALNIGNNDDRISKLPDMVLSHILSFLPTKYAVGTSILSTRWKYLWATVPNLNFDDGMLFHHKMGNRTFMDFVDRVLILRDVSHIQNFRLKCRRECDIPHLNAWVSAAIRRSVQELNLCISLKQPFKLPCNIFTCNTLVVLKLYGKFVLNSPTSICCPNLKILHLNSIIFQDDDLVRNLFSSSLILEDLLLKKCRFNTQPFELRQSLFTCKTLVILKLDGKYVLDNIASVCFPSLKIVHLNSVKFLDEDSANKFFSSCPILENLRVKRCRIDNLRVFSISAPIMKSLTIDWLSIPDEESTEELYDTEFHEYMIVLNAPNLEYLNFKDCVAEAYSVNLSSLSKAYVDVGVTNYYLDESDYDYSDCGFHVLELIRGLSNVKFLSLSSATMENLRFTYGENMPTFHNLMHLELGINDLSDWQLLPYMLESSPNLEVLVFGEGLAHPTMDQDCCWSPSPHVPKCLSFHLKAIKIRGFKGQEGEMKLVKYLLKNAKILKKMTIFLAEKMNMFSGKLDLEVQLKISKTLLMFPRGSTTCQIEFS